MPQSDKLLHLGPIVGATTSTSTKIWVAGHKNQKRKLKVQCSENNDFSAIAAEAEAELVENNDYTATFQLQGLSSDKLYYYRVMDGNARVDMLSPEDSVYPSFKTFPDENDEPSDFTFALGSCFRPFMGPKSQSVGQKVLEHLETVRPKLDLRFIILTGDQVYADLPKPVEKLYWLDPNFKFPFQDFPEDGAETFEDYCKVYRKSWEFPYFRKVFRLMPTYMIFDDHELWNNWGTSNLREYLKKKRRELKDNWDKWEEELRGSWGIWGNAMRDIWINWNVLEEILGNIPGNWSEWRNRLRNWREIDNLDEVWNDFLDKLIDSRDELQRRWFEIDWNKEKNKPRFRNAVRAYQLYQQNHNPEPIYLVPPETEDEHNPNRNFAYKFQYGNVRFFVMDARTHRGQNPSKKAQYLGEKQHAELEKWLMEDKDGPKFIVSSVPIIHAIFGPDQWAVTEEERQRILDFISDNKIRGVHFLSGDVHRAHCVRFERNESPSVPIYSYTSSPLCSSPLPKALPIDMIPGYGKNVKVYFKTGPGSFKLEQLGLYESLLKFNFGTVRVWKENDKTKVKFSAYVYPFESDFKPSFEEEGGHYIDE